MPHDFGKATRLGFGHGVNMPKYIAPAPTAFDQTIPLIALDGWESFGFWTPGGTGIKWGDDGIGETAGCAHFTAVPIPVGATILTASFDANVTVTQTGGGTGTWFLDQGATLGVPLAPSSSPPNLPLTHMWPRRGAQLITGTQYTSSGQQTMVSGAQLVAMIQELIGQAGWASGNNINVCCNAIGNWPSGVVVQTATLNGRLQITWSNP